MYKLILYGNSKPYNYSVFYCDSDEDISSLPNLEQCCAGSRAYVPSSGSVYVLDSTDRWVIDNTSAGSGSGSGSGEAPSGEVDIVLSTTSHNPVRNSTIARRFADINPKLLPGGGAAGDVLAKIDGTNYAVEWKSTDEWMSTDTYDTNKDGVVDKADVSNALKAGRYKATIADKGKNVTLLSNADKGIANGVAALDSNKKILIENIPDAIKAGLVYGGVFNATTRVIELTPNAKSILGTTASTMTLANSATTPEGYPEDAALFYIATAGGTFAGMEFAVGDWLISLATSWKQLQSGHQVSSVNGQTGAVVLDSDDIAQGTTHLFMTANERAKLDDIEDEATRDENVVQSATVMTDEEENDFLRLINKNGTVTDFYGGSVDLTEYLKVDGDASETYIEYTPDATRRAFNNSEVLKTFAAKTLGWLNAIKAVAFSNSYDDLDDKPTYNDVELSGDLNAEDLGTLDVREVNDLPEAPRANTLYIWHTIKAERPWNRYYVYTDDWHEIETGGLDVIGINDDPEDTPPTDDAIYVYKWTDDEEEDHSEVGLMFRGEYFKIAPVDEASMDYNDLTNKPRIDTNLVKGGNQTHESLDLVGVDDFVQLPTGKTTGMEFVLPQGTPASPIEITEIDDSSSMEYSTVHTSSNSKINHRFDSIEQALSGKLNLQFVNELPSPPVRNTQYYVATDESGVWDIYVVDNVGTVTHFGNTAIDTSTFISSSRKVAGIALDADITPTQIAQAIKNESVIVTNKGIDADSNEIANLSTQNFKVASIAQAISGTPVNTKLATEKAVGDYAVPKTTSANIIYGTNSSGDTTEYSLISTVTSSSTTTQIPNAKAIYNYSVPKTNGTSKVYGTNGDGNACNYDRVVSIGSSSTDAQFPTAKAVYTYAVPKTTTGSRLYGTNSSGAAYNYPFSDTYNSSADNQIATRKAVYNLYNSVHIGEQAGVFCGTFTRNSTQSISATTSVKVLLTGSDVYRTNLVSLSSNAIKIAVTGTYFFRFIGRLADTASATRHWYMGGGVGSMADDQMGGQWNYTYFRHKSEATYLRYCTAGESVSPWIYIDGSSGTLNYMTVEVYRLNNK